MSHRVLFTSIFWTLLMTQGLKYSGALKGPCHEELYRLHFDEDAFKPLCTSRGFYEDKQCNSTNCWCVNQCGRAVPGTYGDYFITCEEQPAPCLKEYMASLSSNPVLGQFRPRCGSDGFYHHTQCFGATCFCYDKCGNKVPGSDHPLSHVRDMICACPNDDHAYNCATNPCESATCDYPSATCKPSICGGCRAEFTLGSRLVECGADRCIDDDGTQYQLEAEFERDCQQCYCKKWGEIMCYDKRCPSLERPPDGCNYVIPPGGCCATRVYCQQPTWECLYLDLPIALCDGNPCRFTPCEAYPDAICVVQFCGSKACTAVFQDEHRNELDCSAGKRIPGEILNRPTVIPTTLPTPTPCPPITCGNSCGSSGWKIINGCQTCECVDAPTTIPSCQPVTCTHFCGPSGLKIVNGCEICECADRCIDDDGTQYQLEAEFERDCQQCYCEKWGEIICYDKACPSLERRPDGCDYVIPPGGCCATRVYCQQPTWECLFLDLPIALCDGNPCRFTPCEAYPDAICVVQFCGSKACTAVFQDEHRNELDCSAGKRIPGEILNLSTVIPTTLPTPTPCPPITCGNSCGSSGRKIINGCQTCECVDAPTTIPSCQPVTCTHFCGPSGLKIVNGCEICECAKPEEIISTTTPPTTTSPPCPLITCKNSCPFGRKIISGCRTCECIDGSHSSISKPTAAPSECMDSDGRYHANGESWIPDPCMTCICENGDVKCFHQYCEVLPLYCEVDSVQDPQACCPRFTCPESCTDSLGNERSINEVYIEGCQTCTCMPSGKSRCTPIPCPPPVTNPPAGCRHVIPPGGCCPTRLACTESEKDCVRPVAQCLQNACLHEVCEVYPDAKCSISFCGLRACRAVFYDENDQEVDCKKAEIIRVADGDCYDESSGKTYKVGDEFTNECNDCTCMQDGQIVCSEKPCGCVEASSGKFYKIGDSYNDRCNQCICKEDGFMCSRKICKGEEN